MQIIIKLRVNSAELMEDTGEKQQQQYIILQFTLAHIVL